MARKIGLVLFPDVEVLDFAGPWEVFGALAPATGDQLFAVAEAAGPVRSSQALEFVANTSFADCPQLDLILVPGGAGTRSDRIGAVVEFVRAQAPAAEIVASVCTGAFVLQQAGLLQGRPSATHWRYNDQLRALGVDVRDERYVHDGKLWTSAGVSAGIDMALAIVGALHGEETGRRIQHGIEYDPAPPFPVRIAPPSGAAP